MKTISLTINGKKIPINNFLKSFFASTLKGMAAPLRGGKNAKKIKIEIEY
jgi:hypothetical protein